MELAEINGMTRRSYDIAAGRYHELFKDEMARKAYDRQLLDEFSGWFTKDSILFDMGCGPSGHIGRWLFDKGLDVAGIDISGRCLEIASRHNPGMRFLGMDMSDLAIGDGEVDGIIAFYSIIHTPKVHVPRLFREFHRVLGKGGKLLVTVKEGGEEERLDEFLGFDTTIHFTHFRRREIETYFVEHGFKLLLLDSRAPIEEEIAVSRIYAIGEKR